MEEKKKKATRMEYFQKTRFIYVFQYKIVKDKFTFYRPFCELLYDDENIVKYEYVKPCVHIKLYEMPDEPPYDKQIKEHNYLLSLRLKYFSEVFQETSYKQGHLPQSNFFTVILPKETYDGICELIDSNGLTRYKDLIFELICTAQDKYTSDIYNWDTPEYQKIIRTADKEANKVIDIIQRSGADTKLIMNVLVELVNLPKVKFQFDKDPVTLEHPWLIRDFIDGVKKQYDGYPLGNYEKELKRYSSRFEDIKKADSFKYMLAKSLYNLIMENKLMSFEAGVKTPQNVMVFIYKFLEYCEIEVGSEGDSESEKARHIRNWLERNELNPSIKYLEIPADKELLSKYFPSPFLSVADDMKRADVISIAFFIVEKFDIPDLFPDLVHIAACIKGNHFIGHQLSSNFSVAPPVFEEYHSLKKLMNGVKSKNKLVELSFKMEGDNKVHTIKQRLPLYLIEEALKDSYSAEQIEYDTDLVKREQIGTNPETYSYSFKELPERYMPQLVHSLFNFFKDNSGIEDSKYVPGKPYYEIIGILLKECWFFYNKMIDDKYAIAKVEQWHKLNSNS
jgi:hypothetical protein